MPRLIDADAAIWELKTGCFPQSMEYTRAVGIAKRLIQEMPTIEAEPVRHGRWECVIEIVPGISAGQCSECGRCDFVKNYCPNCGAKMDGDANDKG